MFILVIFFWVFFEEESASAIRRDLVCTDFRSYQNPGRYNNCNYNPDIDSTAKEITNRYGFSLTEHTVDTEDGYVLVIFRISIQNDQNINQKQPVILQHGILVDGRSWFMSGNNSLAFVMARAGFDVWIPNFRGTTYSKSHLNSSISQKDYWNFSFHELGIYDLPAIIEYVSKSTNRTDILYVGHSMGTTTFMVYSSIKTDHAQQHIKGVLHLAPVVYLNNLPPILQIIVPFAKVIKNILNLLKIFSIGPEIRNFISALGYTNYITVLGAQLGMALVSGYVPEQIRPEMVPLIIKFFPSDLSVNILLHYSQTTTGCRGFRQFDYGYIENMKKYNSALPPKYELEKVKIPTYILTGYQDLLAEVRSVYCFYEQIKAQKDMRIYEVSHLDYAYGKELSTVYSHILEILHDFSKK